MALIYSAHPFEIVPLFWNGGDGLHYGLAWYDEQLGAEHAPAVSYAPIDDRAQWLGNTTEAGVRNLLAWYTHQQAQGKAWAQQHQEQGQALGDALGVDLSAASPLHHGARSGRTMRPAVPAGWRFVPDGDGIGTLAPADTFSTEASRDHGWDSDAWLEDGHRALQANFPGTALAAFRRGYQTSTGEADAALGMRQAYLRLGRTPLAARVTEYLKHR
jgi:hypothetical protein